MMLIDAIRAEHTRGIGVVIDQTLAALDDLPLATATIALTGPDSPPYRNLAVNRIPTVSSRIPRIAFQRFLLSSYIQRLNRHGHRISTAFLMDSYVPYGAKRSPVDYWAFVHDVLPLTHPQFLTPLRVAIKRAGFSAIQRSGARIVTSSEHNADVVEHVLGQRPEIARYGCGQLTDREADAAYGRLTTSRDSSIVAIGTLQARKGLPTLIRGFAHAVPNLPIDARLRIVGSGSSTYAGELEELATELGVRRRVEFVGPVCRDDAINLMKYAGGVAFPSAAEGFGLPILEALALGTPVVASDLPEVRSWAGDTIVYARPSSPSHLSQAIERLLSGDHPTPEMGQEVARAYRWNSFAASLAALARR